MIRLAWILVAGITTATSLADTRIAIFVTGPKPAGEFVDSDQGVQDSIRDLQSEIKNRRGLRLAPTANQAEVILRVTARGIQSESDGGSLAMPIGRAIYLGPTYVNYHVVRAFIEVGDYEKDVSIGLDGIGGAWKECAEQITKTVEAWTVANRARLMQRRTGAELAPKNQ